MNARRRLPSRSIAVLLASAPLCLASLAEAQAGCECACRWDQRNDAFVLGGYNLSFGSVGQEFVPTTSQLDSVELQVNVQSGAAGEIFVRVRRDTITGTILGVSDSAFVSTFGFPLSLRRFEFDQPVPLTPGSRHVLEFVHASGDQLAVFLTGFGGDPYPAGRAIVGGSPVALDDFWFRAGSKRDLLGQPDQINDPFASGGWVLDSGISLAQEFRPTNSYLDVVELMMNTQSSGVGYVFVRVRADDLSGTVLGTSDVVDVSVNTPAHLRQFRFAQPVPLRPGQLHVMEFVHAGGVRLGVFLTGWGNNTYAFGQSWAGGTPYPSDDFWFRLGGACDPLAREDQVNDPVVSGGFVLSGASSVGQEFTPSDSRLDLVELHLNVQGSGTGDALVRIRSGSMGGKILGTSDPVSVSVAGNPISPRRFLFEQPVPLQPGQLHVMEVVHLSGSSLGVFLTGWGSNTYANGRAIQGGVPRALEDLCFRTGSVTEPIGVPDQVNEVVSSGGLSIPNFALGQQFVPTLPWLDYVELEVNTQGVGTAYMLVRIRHSDGLYGAVRGVSERVAVDVQGNPLSIRRFEFEQPVPLVPGEMHVIEILHSSGPPVAVWGGGDTYSAGGRIVDGVYSSLDFWFREGGRPDCAYPAAATAFRNAGANPVSYSAGAATVGEPWTATVNLASTGHTFAQIQAYTSPMLHTMPGGQVLLVGGPRLFQFPLKQGPLAVWTTVIPYDCSIVGLTAYSQAVHVFGVKPFALSNAQDLFIGY